MGQKFGVKSLWKRGTGKEPFFQKGFSPIHSHIKLLYEYNPYMSGDNFFSSISCRAVCKSGYLLGCENVLIAAEMA